MTNSQAEKRPKRHCMVVHAYYPAGETRVEREALALVDYGLEVDVLCLRRSGQKAFETLEGVNVYRLPAKRYKRSSAARQLLEYMAFFVVAFAKLTALHFTRRYAVIQVHNLPDFLVFAALVPKLSGARVILDLHDLMPEFYAARFHTDMDSRAVKIVRWQEQLSCRFADHAITVTELWRQALIERGIPPDKITVVMNVANSRFFHRRPLSKTPIGEDDRLDLIYHGGWPRRYGIDVAIRAVHIVREKVPAIHLTIHGGGDEREALFELTKELDLERHISFSTKLLPSSMLPQLIRKADIGLVPYRRDVFTDGILPTKLMEYVALGLPVIAARTTAITAYFDDTMVQYFSPGDPEDLARCILELCTNQNRLAELVANSDRFNNQYNWCKLSTEYTALVDRLSK